MSTRADPLAAPDLRPDRLHYATGELLDRDDFLAEQLYHRGRLSRVLLHLHGTGTAAGLRVHVEGADQDPAGEERVRVDPGLAIDRLGRLVELPRSACLRLGRWLENLAGTREDDLSVARFAGGDGPITTQFPADDDVPQARRPGDDARDAPAPPAADEWQAWSGYVVADAFVRFAACERGKTPAFATGPYDALDAVQPSRVRDAYELELRLRTETPDPPLPADPWAGVGGAGADARARAAARQLMDAGWRDAALTWNERGELDRLPEHGVGQDPTSVFLARLFIPLLPNGRERDPGQRVLVNNHLRRFAFPGPALAWLARG